MPLENLSTLLVLGDIYGSFAALNHQSLFLLTHPGCEEIVPLLPDDDAAAVLHSRTYVSFETTEGKSILRLLPSLGHGLAHRHRLQLDRYNRQGRN